jgi:AcrR family transcriptional regulator
LSPKPDVSEERKNQILDAAINVFAKSGFSDARMDDIVQESGISKGGLYWYFKSKDQIIFAVLDRMIQREFDTFLSEKNKLESARDQFLLLIDLVEKDMGRFNFLMPVLFEFYAMGLRNASVRKMLSKSLQSYIDLIVPIIEQGIANGEFRSCDPIEAALAVGAVMEGTILLKGYNPDLVDLNKHIRSGAELLLNGILVNSKNE